MESKSVYEQYIQDLKKEAIKLDLALEGLIYLREKMMERGLDKEEFDLNFDVEIDIVREVKLKLVDFIFVEESERKNLNLVVKVS